MGLVVMGSRDMMASVLIGRRGPRVTEARSEEVGDTVRCVHGANEQNLPDLGRTVAWVRANLKDALNLAPDSMAVLDGRPVGEEHVLEVGRTLEFLRPLGRKGVGRVWTVEQFCELFQIGAEQFEHLLGVGLPKLSWPDGTIRIPEEQVDRFLDELFGFARRPIPVPPEFLSPPDAAAFLGITTEALEHLRKSRKIRAVQVGEQRGFAFAVTDLRDFAARRTVPTAEEVMRNRGRRLR